MSFNESRSCNQKKLSQGITFFKWPECGTISPKLVQNAAGITNVCSRNFTSDYNLNQSSVSTKLLNATLEK